MKNSDEDLPPLTPATTARLVYLITAPLRAACEASPGRIPSNEATKLMLKRVSPNNKLSFATLDRYWVIVADELTQILDRILAYQYVTQYRKELRSDAQLMNAWQIHSQSLRSGELYIVQVRTAELLTFLAQICSDCGLPVSNQRSAFDRAFEKQFQRRLRERHRLVHAHERPSMESRIISLMSATSDFANEEVTQIFSETLGRAMEGAQANHTTETGLTVANIEKIHEEASIVEARQMLKLVADSLIATLRDTPPKPQ